MKRRLLTSVVMMSWGSEFKENQKFLQTILYIFLHEVLLSDLSVQA